MKTVASKSNPPAGSCSPSLNLWNKTSPFHPTIQNKTEVEIDIKACKEMVKDSLDGLCEFKVDVNLHLNLQLYTQRCLWALRFDSVRNGSLLKCDTGPTLAGSPWAKNGWSGLLFCDKSPSCHSQGAVLGYLTAVFYKKPPACLLSLKPKVCTAQISECIDSVEIVFSQFLALHSFIQHGLQLLRPFHMSHWCAYEFTA